MSESFYFQEGFVLSDNTDILLMFKQDSKDIITLVGSMFSPVIITPQNVTTYLPNFTYKYLDNAANLRRLQVMLARATDPTIGTIYNPM